MVTGVAKLREAHEVRVYHEWDAQLVVFVFEEDGSVVGGLGDQVTQVIDQDVVTSLTVGELIALWLW